MPQRSLKFVAASLLAFMAISANAQNQPRSFKCKEPLPEFTLGPNSNPSPAEVAKLCACIWSKFPVGGWERDVSTKIAQGQDPGWKVHGFGPRFGAALDACGGRNL